MKKLLTLIAVALIASSSFAQKRKAKAPKTPAVPILEQARQAVASYDFARAEDLLTKEITALSKKKQPTAQVESLLNTARQGRTKLHATERIVIIDTIVCATDEALELIRISRENGRIDTYASTYHTQETNGAMLFENELANKRYLAVPVKAEGDSAANLRLAVTDKIGEQWTEPILLRGLNDNDIEQNYPFLMADGITLYYAAKGPESIGGYDIFVSRADGEDGTFLSPENIGFPFNSTANDYLMVIDEINQFGWFVSDRYQPDGQVCIYIFLPNATREVYGDEVSEEELRARARITNIKDSWSLIASEDMKKARQRLADVRSTKIKEQNTEPQFHFVIDDRRIYTSIEDFKSKSAKTKMQQWVLLKKNNDTDATMLARLRDLYASSDNVQREKLQLSIRKIEDSYYSQTANLKQLAKEIRNEEISNK